MPFCEGEILPICKACDTVNSTCFELTADCEKIECPCCTTCVPKEEEASSLLSLEICDELLEIDLEDWG